MAVSGPESELDGWAWNEYHATFAMTAAADVDAFAVTLNWLRHVASSSSACRSHRTIRSMSRSESSWQTVPRSDESCREHVARQPPRRFHGNKPSIVEYSELATRSTRHGDAENAGLENAAPENARRKMQKGEWQWQWIVSQIHCTRITSNNQTLNLILTVTVVLA